MIGCVLAIITISEPEEAFALQAEDEILYNPRSGALNDGRMETGYDIRYTQSL